MMPLRHIIQSKSLRQKGDRRTFFGAMSDEFVLPSKLHRRAKNAHCFHWPKKRMNEQDLASKRGQPKCFKSKPRQNFSKYEGIRILTHFHESC
jgi:hypothetical protein